MDRSKRFTLFAVPGRPVHSDTNSASPGSILVRQQLRAKTKSLTCPPPSIARYSFIQLSQLGPQWRERKCPIFETVANGDSNPGSLDCESGILPLSYRAPYRMVQLYGRSCCCVVARLASHAFPLCFHIPRDASIGPIMTYVGTIGGLVTEAPLRFYPELIA